LNKYLKCSVWRLALRYDIYIYIYMSLGFKRLNSSVQNLPSTVSSHFAFSQPIFYPVLFNIRNNIAFCRVPRICPLFFWYNNVCMNMTDLQAKNTLSFIWISSPYRAVNISSLIKANQLMLYREIIAVCSEIHTKHINTLCGQNVEFVNVKLVVHILTAGF